MKDMTLDQAEQLLEQRRSDFILHAKEVYGMQSVSGLGTPERPYRIVVRGKGDDVAALAKNFGGEVKESASTRSLELMTIVFVRTKPPNGKGREN